MEKILIVDDNESLRYTLESVLETAGYHTKSVEDGIKAVEEVKNGDYDLIICDLKLPKKDGMQILKEVKAVKPAMPLIILTAFGDIKNAVEAIKKGAADYLTKPFNNEDMILTIRKALELKYLNKELEILRKKSDKRTGIIGECDKMKDVFEQVRTIAPTNMTVLLQGESGTGKELIANMIHRSSNRIKKEFIAVDCGAIPETLMEAELFGHEKGAYTDAKTQRIGKFELANGGTIFLDEISNLSETNQIKLLRTIQERKITRIGGKNAIKLDVRIITASNINLADAVNSKRFRADLYYRINEFILSLPSLRERKEDIPLLVKLFIEDANKEFDKNVESISNDVMNKIKKHSWPGNIRELRNTIRRAVLMSKNNIINQLSIDDSIQNSSFGLTVNDNATHNLEDVTQNAEREAILKAISESGGNKSKAARKLNINERTFYRKLKSLGIN